MTITNDKLTWVYTTYGLNRLTETMLDTADKLYLTKFKIGDANGTFYLPTVNSTELVNPIPDGTFYINEKGLEGDGLTVYFKTTFPENSDGYEIMEIGFYETLNEIDYLFAIGTCQPLVKPSVDDNYVISVDYTLRLKSVNLSSVYDQIVLDADNEYAEQDSLDSLQTSILYIEGNLMEQISNNSHIIGLNRAAQLHDKQTEDLQHFSDCTSTLCFTNLLNFTELDNIDSYWLFNYSKYTTNINSVVDFSKYAINLSLNKNMNLYTRDYRGLAPYLDISGSDYFTLDSSVDFNLLDSSNTTDTPVTLLFLVEHNSINTKGTLLAKSNYYSNNHSFEVNKLSDGSIEFKLFTDEDNYITCVSAADSTPTDMYFLAVTYDGNISSPTMNIFVNFSYLPCTTTTTGTYTGMTNVNEDLTSYTIDSGGALQDYVDSKVSIVSLIKDIIVDYELKSIALNMMSLSGKDTCLVV